MGRQLTAAPGGSTPKLTNGVKTLLANCIAHGRRQSVEVAGNFPQECGCVLELLGMVYGIDALAREQGLDPEKRLRFHRQYSGPLMDQLHGWLEEQLAMRRQNPTQGWAKRSPTY